MGPLELILIVVVVVLIFGARKIPELGKGFGQGIREFKRGVKDDEDKRAAPLLDDAKSKPEDRV